MSSNSEKNTEEVKKDKVAKMRVGRADFREAHKPEPYEKDKKISGKAIISWGPDNLYPHEMVGWREDNPVHGGIISQKVTFMTSAGAVVTGLEGKEQEVEMILPDAVDCFETFNGFAVLFKRVGTKNPRWKPQHIDFESVRYMQEEGWFAISDDWSARSQSEEKTNFKEVKCIKHAKLVGDEADKEVLLYAKIKPKQRKYANGKLSLCYYPVPNYSGAIIPILAGIEQDYFTYSELVNGYKGGTLVVLNNGQPETDDEADEIADNIKGEATDRDRQGGIAVVFTDGGENPVSVESLNGNDLHLRYIESNKEIRSKILIGHSAGSPTLFAVNSESTFGSKEEMEVSYILLTNNYINKRQTFVSDSIEWAYARLGQKNVNIQFKKYQLDLNGQGNGESTTEQMSKAKDPVIIALSRIGKKRSSSEILDSRVYDFEAADEEYLTTFKKKNKFAELTKDQQLITQLIKDGKSFKDIATELKKGALWLSRQIVTLNAKGVLSGWKVKDDSEVKLEVRYSYEVKPGLGDPVIDTSRDFCRTLIQIDRLYTRQEIDLLSGEFDRDVWRYRGGWYHNPKTDTTTPSCRHEWRQNVVRR